MKLFIVSFHIRYFRSTNVVLMMPIGLSWRYFIKHWRPAVIIIVATFRRRRNYIIAAVGRALISSSSRINAPMGASY